MKLSVIISAHNEEKNIEECLKSVKNIADEIILIDNSSTDNTATVAKKMGAEVISRKNNKMLNVNKNFGFSNATGDWILSIDADERVTNDLSSEISDILKSHSTTINNNSQVAYRLPRKNIIFGKWIEHTGWYPDYQTRLFKRDKAKFAEKHNHEQLSVDGEIGSLEYPIVHDHYKSIDEFLKKTFFSYTDNEADELQKNGYSFKAEDIIRIPFQEFLSRYFARQGYKDGIHGLALSLLMAFYHLVVVLKIWEREKFKDDGTQDTRKMLLVQAKNIQTEIKHWDTEIELKKMSPIRQTVERVKRKLT